MNKGDVHNVLSKHLHTIAGKCKDVSPHYEVETIHKLRTEVKKLRALLVLHIGIENLRLPKSFRKMYHAVGDLRDLQVQLQHLVEERGKTTLPNFALWLATSIGSAEQHWDKVYDKQAIDKLEHYMRQQELPDLTPDDLVNFFRETLQQTASFISGTPDDEALHQVRKYLKILMYLAEWCEKHWPEGWEALRVFPVPDLKHISDLAGNYNDLRIGIELLNQYLKEEKDEAAIEGARHVRGNRMHRKARRRRILITTLRRISIS